MANKGMSFRLTIHPFTVTGTVGGEVVLHSAVSGGVVVTGREDIYVLGEKLERMCDEVSRLHGWEGEWGVKEFDTPLEEAKNDGVPV